MFAKLVQKNRSYRRFDETYRVRIQDLESLIDLARQCPSAANLQPLKYILSVDPGMNRQIFDTLSWAAYLKDWDGPLSGERPTAYIIMLRDKGIRKVMEFDQGIAAQTIMLGAVEVNLGGCLIASYNRQALHTLLSIPETMESLIVIALGKPVETVVIDLIENGDVKYWRDSEAVHHVPKRSLEELIFRSIK